MNRLTAKTADGYFVLNGLGAAAVNYTYMATGKRAAMTDASGVTSYTYDPRGRLITKATPEGTLAYSYDVVGNVKSIQSSNASGAAMTYAYDALNRPTTVTDSNGVSTYSYDAVGNLAGVAYANGVAHSYSYDQRNRLANLAVTGGRMRQRPSRRSRTSTMLGLSRLGYWQMCPSRSVSLDVRGRSFWEQVWEQTPPKYHVKPC